ncbi:MAG: hypothetical protein ACREPM_03385 [Gemmatimonadaceae bacterium]
MTGIQETARIAGGGPAPTEPQQETKRLIWTKTLRDLFDKTRFPVAIVAAAGVLTGGAVWLMRHMAGDCADPPVAINRIEVAFRAAHFKELLAAEGHCRAAVVAGFGWDFFFIATYPFLLAALYLWAERWRRVNKPEGQPHATAPFWFRGRFFVAAPIIAGLLDAFPENGLLWPAAVLVGRTHSPFVQGLAAVMVAIGSAGSALKWTLLLVSIWGICAETLSGPRGAVLRRLRFSALAAILGAVPLLVVPQGQDILQRLAEGSYPVTRVSLSVLAVVFAAFAVWKCGRVLVELRLKDDSAWAAGDPWSTHFAEQIPRVLGVALPAIAGVAFAKEAGSVGAAVFIAIAASGLLIAAWRSEQLERLGTSVIRLFRLPEHWLSVPAFPSRIGAAVVAWVIALGLFYRGLPWAVAGSLSNDERATRALLTAAWLCYVAAWMFYLYVYFRIARDLAKRHALAPMNREVFVQQLAKESSARYDAVDLDVSKARKYARPVAVLAAMSLVVVIVFARDPVPVARTIGPLWVLGIFAANTVFFGSIAVWIYAQFHIPIVRLGLAAAVLFGIWNENHRVRTVDGSLSTVKARKTLDEHLDEWLASRSHAGKTRIPVVLVAAAGGGLRAAYWTATVLASAQDSDSTFAGDVFAISGVSGGSVGAALFTALVKDAHGPAPAKSLSSCAGRLTGDDTAGAAKSPFMACVHAFMRDDFLSPILAKIVGPDLAQRFLPIALPRTDRSLGLEESWERSYASAMGDTTWQVGLSQLVTDSSIRSSIPALLLNSTHVETGRRYIAATVRIDAAFPDAKDVLEVLQHDVRLSTAAHNSARFTYVSPAGHLESGDGSEYGRVVDGGYFENSGLVTLREVYDAIVNRKDSRLVPIVVYLCNDPVGCTPDDKTRQQNADSLARVSSTSVNEVLSPVRAVLNARDARAALAQSELQGLLGDTSFIQLNVCRDSVAVVVRDTARARDRTVSPPLGWLLSAMSREWMDASIRSPAAAGEGHCRQQNVAGLTRLTQLRLAPRSSK